MEGQCFIPLYHFHLLTSIETLLNLDANDVNENYIESYQYESYQFKKR